MVMTRSRRFTIDDFLKLPEVWPPFEFYGGRVVQKMSPRLPHSVVQRDLTIKIQLFATAAQLGEVFPELRCTFGGSSYVFDLSYFVTNRLPNPTDAADCLKIEVPPDLAIEILSPGQTVGELSRKLRTAIRRGVRLGWLVDKARKQVHVFRRPGKGRVLKVGDVLDGGDVLPGFALPLTELFAKFAQD